jgi:phenylacetic acid degradation operon negative regulatory protein
MRQNKIRPHFLLSYQGTTFSSILIMNSKTEELLWMLLWGCEKLSRPTWRNLTESFEGWAYRNGLLRQLQRLEKQQLLEHQPRGSGSRMHRLTQAGCLHALGGRAPQACWNRRWDGRWRLVIYDVPEIHNIARNKIRRYLQNRGFGYLQNSVWITPHPVDEERALLAEGPADVESLVLLEARPCAGETDAEIVAGAWDFAEINRRYATYHKVLARRPCFRLETKAAATAFHHWLRAERQTWLDAMRSDPLLPVQLLPPGYAGREAWRNRLRVMAETSEQMQTFRCG